MAKRIKLPLAAPLSYRELSDIISGLEAKKKSFTSVGMKRPAYEMGRLLKKMKGIYKKCNLKMILIYKRY